MAENGQTPVSDWVFPSCGIIEGMKRKWRARGGAWAAAVGGAVLLSGCFTARTGEFYQETKAARIASPWALTDEDRQLSIFSMIKVPFKVLFQGLDVFLFNPLWDMAMVPVDACFPQHGQLLRVVDEKGVPVADARVVVEGSYRKEKDGWTDYTFSQAGRDAGTTDADGLFSFSRRHRAYALFDCRVEAPGFHTRRVIFHANSAAGAPKADAKGRSAIEVTVNRVRDPIASPVRPFSIPIDWTRGEQEWVRGYDLAKGAWLPPFGRGEAADIAVAVTMSKAKGTKKVVLMPGESGAAFARLPTQPFVDPRYFIIDYTLPATANFSTEVCLQAEGEGQAHDNLLVADREYVAYRIRRPDGVHVGALLPTRIDARSGMMRNIYNSKPGSQTLEYLSEDMREPMQKQNGR